MPRGLTQHLTTRAGRLPPNRQGRRKGCSEVGGMGGVKVGGENEGEGGYSAPAQAEEGGLWGAMGRRGANG